MKIQVSWEIASVTGKWLQISRRILVPPLSGSSSPRTVLDHEDGGTKIFRNDGNYLPFDIT
jgi:hypothetical protein